MVERDVTLSQNQSHMNESRKINGRKRCNIITKSITYEWMIGVLIYSTDQHHIMMLETWNTKNNDTTLHMHNTKATLHFH